MISLFTLIKDIKKENDEKYPLYTEDYFLDKVIQTLSGQTVFSIFSP